MKVFQNRNGTRIPRVDTIYLLARIMILLALCWHFYIAGNVDVSELFMWVVLGTYGVQLAIYGLGMMGRFDMGMAYLLTILYDLVILPVVIIFVGPAIWTAFMMLFVTVTVAAYVLTFPFATTVAAIGSISYLVAVEPQLELGAFVEVALSVGFAWICYLAVAHTSRYQRHAERRLMGLFDKLNMRTSELESSQAQLEVIYENSRVLASILDVDGIAKAVDRILGSVLHYEQFGMILRDEENRYYYRARSIGGNCYLHPRALDDDEIEMIQRVCESAEPLRVVDISDVVGYFPLSEDTRSLLAVPMVSRGEVRGILIAESATSNFFHERDLQLVSIVGRAAALAMENAELHQRTEELTITDALTGAFNYRYFVKKLEEEKRRASRYNLALSIIMVDIDWFKKVNDSYGHEAGNIILRDLGCTIKDCVRDVDIFFRYGGEEFVIILPQTHLKEATLIGERIRLAVAATDHKIGGGEALNVTVSVGVSSFPENGHSQEELVSLADKALYRAKEEGKNLVCTI